MMNLFMTRRAQVVCVVNMFPSDVLAVEEQAVSEPRLDILRILCCKLNWTEWKGGVTWGPNPGWIVLCSFPGLVLFRFFVPSCKVSFFIHIELVCTGWLFYSQRCFFFIGLIKVKSLK